jgi:hypothetical protein
MRIAVRDTPLMELTLRRYEKPQSMNERELVRKLCLSIGLLQPGDSRDVVVDVLHILLRARKFKKEISSEEIDKEVVMLRREQNLPMIGIAASNIRRQIKRLRNIHLVQKVKNKYRINEFSQLGDIYDEKIQKFMLSNIEARVKEYFQAADARFS